MVRPKVKKPVGKKPVARPFAQDIKPVGSRGKKPIVSRSKSFVTL